MFTQVLQNNLQDENIYLSPILVQVNANSLDSFRKAISVNNWQPKHNPYKSDVFSLGMCMLHAALNDPCDDCYNYQEGRIKEDVLREKQSRLREKGYSDAFSRIIATMLSKNEDSRPDFVALCRLLEDQSYSEGSILRHQQIVHSEPDLYYRQV